jgi:hypothetical protein
MYGYTGITFFADEETLTLINFLVCGGETGSGKFKMSYLAPEESVAGFDWGYGDAVDSRVSQDDKSLSIEFTHIGGLSTGYFNYLLNYLGSILEPDQFEIYMRSIDTDRQCFALYSYKDGDASREFFYSDDVEGEKNFLKNVKTWFGKNWKAYGEEIHFEELQKGKA